MRTELPIGIATVEQAKAFLTDLVNNDEAYHPDDDAHTIVWTTVNPTEQERDHLNKLMKEIFELTEEFDPYAFILDLVNAEN
jgi:hypothetical protein